MQVIARDPSSVEEDGLTLEEMSLLRARLREVPSDLEARVSLARSLLECGQLSEAFLHLRLAGVPGGQRGQASYLMGLAHIWSGDHSAAVDDLLVAVRLLPNSAPALAALDAALGGIVEAPVARGANSIEWGAVKNRLRTVDPESAHVAQCAAA